ncbi:ATP-binding protein [Streptomyces sp. ML-6]|uniref:AAA family ATPase n=1 Tax=Streptomyces sp. ML-6 TaxID=2982693 RepID=UPI0024C03D1E|nr:ATP-binding protein [Streptomyces sp. ML-6]MDK0524473.1 AAA family ATPase [Streptomyces sp. ML-6]
MTLLSRDAERTQLDDALAACVRGGTGLVLVEGAVGCGKSALLRYCADAAHRQGVTTVRAAYPDCPTDLTTALDDVPEPTPVVVCLDDIHHADAASLGRLTAGVRTTAHPARDGGLLLVLAATDAPYHDAGLATELLKHPACTRIRVGPLDRTATAALVRRHTGEPTAPAVADGLYLASGGNPLLLRALLAEPGHVPEPGGPFSRAVLTCLERCGAPAPHLARALAALGDSATAERAASVLRTTPTETGRTLTALRAAGLALGDRLRHAAAAAAVLDDMDPEEREGLHRRVARVLHASRAEAAVIADSLRACGGIDGSQGSGGSGGDRGVRRFCGFCGFCGFRRVRGLQGFRGASTISTVPTVAGSYPYCARRHNKPWRSTNPSAPLPACNLPTPPARPTRTNTHAARSCSNSRPSPGG